MKILYMTYVGTDPRYIGKKIPVPTSIFKEIQSSEDLESASKIAQTWSSIFAQGGDYEDTVDVNEKENIERTNQLYGALKNKIKSINEEQEEIKTSGGSNNPFVHLAHGWGSLVGGVRQLASHGLPKVVAPDLHKKVEDMETLSKFYNKGDHSLLSQLGGAALSVVPGVGSSPLLLYAGGRALASKGLTGSGNYIANLGKAVLGSQSRFFTPVVGGTISGGVYGGLSYVPKDAPLSSRLDQAKYGALFGGALDGLYTLGSAGISRLFANYLNKQKYPYSNPTIKVPGSHNEAGSTQTKLFAERIFQNPEAAEKASMGQRILHGARQYFWKSIDDNLENIYKPVYTRFAKTLGKSVDSKNITFQGKGTYLSQALKSLKEEFKDNKDLYKKINVFSNRKNISTQIQQPMFYQFKAFMSDKFGEISNSEWGVSNKEINELINTLSPDNTQFKKFWSPGNNPIKGRAQEGAGKSSKYYETDNDGQGNRIRNTREKLWVDAKNLASYRELIDTKIRSARQLTDPDNRDQLVSSLIKFRDVYDELIVTLSTGTFPIYSGGKHRSNLGSLFGGFDPNFRVVSKDGSKLGKERFASIKKQANKDFNTLASGFIDKTEYDKVFSENPTVLQYLRGDINSSQMSAQLFGARSLKDNPEGAKSLEALMGLKNKKIRYALQNELLQHVFTSSYHTGNKLMHAETIRNNIISGRLHNYMGRLFQGDQDKNIESTLYEISDAISDMVSSPTEDPVGVRLSHGYGGSNLTGNFTREAARNNMLLKHITPSEEFIAGIREQTGWPYGLGVNRLGGTATNVGLNILPEDFKYGIDYDEQNKELDLTKKEDLPVTYPGMFINHMKGLFNRYTPAKEEN